MFNIDQPIDAVRARMPGATHPDVLIAAQDDVSAMREWIDRYQHSPHTFSAAIKDAERFYLWAQGQGLTLRSVRKQDCEQYRAFLANPQPSEQWCGPARPRRKKDGSHNPEWRPFRGPLQASSVRQTCTQMFGLYEFLSNANYVSGNPWRLLGKMPSPDVVPSDQVERFLDRDAMGYLKSTIDSMKDGAAIQRKHYARVRWIFSLLYLSGARRSEFVDAKMKDVRCTNGKWWWRVKGKGGKAGDIPVNDELLAELGHYRESLGLSRLPAQDEETALLTVVTGKLRPITSSALYKVVKRVLDLAADAAWNNHNTDSERMLRSASTHWMRHTSATDQANAPGADLKIVSKNLRHSSLMTTSIYLHAERNTRHDQTQLHRMWTPGEEQVVEGDPEASPAAPNHAAK